jgi:hypothetical protein
MRVRQITMVALAVVLSGAAAQAHHSVAATYNEDATVTIEGELVQFLYRNPHSFVHVQVTEKNGNRVRYAVEWGGAGQLGGQGVTRQTFKPGDHVIITGAPGRNPADHRVRMLTLHRPKDGFDWGHRPGEVND